MKKLLYIGVLLLSARAEFVYAADDSEHIECTQASRLTLHLGDLLIHLKQVLEVNTVEIPLKFNELCTALEKGSSDIPAELAITGIQEALELLKQDPIQHAQALYQAVLSELKKSAQEFVQEDSAASSIENTLDSSTLIEDKPLTRKPNCKRIIIKCGPRGPQGPPGPPGPQGPQGPPGPSCPVPCPCPTFCPPQCPPFCPVPCNPCANACGAIVGTFSYCPDPLVPTGPSRIVNQQGNSFIVNPLPIGPGHFSVVFNTAFCTIVGVAVSSRTGDPRVSNLSATSFVITDTAPCDTVSFIAMPVT